MSDYSSIRKSASKIFISNKNGVKICQNCDNFFENLDIFFHIHNCENLPLFFTIGEIFQFLLILGNKNYKK